MKKNPYEKMTGVGLIEVLVTMLILSTTLITLAALQARSLQYNHGSYLGSQANILAYDILDRMRINKSHVNEYVVAPSVFTSGSTAPTSSLAALDIHQWRENIEAQMPGGKGEVACTTNRICTITISWNEANNVTDNNSTADRQSITSFKYVSRL